ncbi:MAG TPA: hypothetical protein VIU40_02120, partial [Geobacteraceae bacterium]
MKRKLFAIVAFALVFGATSALAESKISGMYKLQGILASVDGATESDSLAGIDQRVRVKWTNAINEFVALTYFAEIDTAWGLAGRESATATDSNGDTVTVSHGNGGKLGADG